MPTSSSPENVRKLPVAPRIVPRSEHCISRSQISEPALKVLYRLKSAGYKAYLVGGSVRDLLLGQQPKDFDIATDALPEQVRELFRNCRLIGRRFRLAHVHFGREIIEVATFRAQHDEEGEGDRVVKDGLIVKDNVYGDIDEDAWRRDFTVNGLYYNIEDFTVVDYVGGVADVRARQLRLIGDPETRYREDPVRMLRAVRFAAKLNFSIHPETAAPIARLGELLLDIPPARLFEEFNKLFMSGYAHATYVALDEAGLFALLFPQVAESIRDDADGFAGRFVEQAFKNTDRRIAEDKPVTPAFLLAALLWLPLQILEARYRSDGVPPMDAVELAADAVISRQIARVAVPRRFTRMMREIWSMQPRLLNRQPRRVRRLLENSRFRAAYDFLLLRAAAGDAVSEQARWWTDFQEADDNAQNQLVNALRPAGRSSGSRRRRRRR